jgi:hypothetical protein
MSFSEFYIRNVAGNIKTIVLTLENKDEGSKKLLMEVEIKTKKILRVIALSKKGVKYLYCINGKIKYLHIIVVL